MIVDKLKNPKEFPNVYTILCAKSEFSYFFANTQFLIKKNVIPLLNVLSELTCQVRTKRNLFKDIFATFVKCQLKKLQQSFSL